MRGVWSLPPEDHAMVLAALAPFRDQVFRDAREAGRREPAEAYDADALVALAGDGVASAHGGTDRPGRSGPRGSGRAAKVIVRVDHGALMRGHPIEGEVCEVTGVGPVPVRAVRRWIADDAFVAAILTKGVDVRSVVHLGRQATALQRTALEWLAPECCVRGCPNQARLEIDHEQDWARTHHTTLDELDHLCAHHHRMKTRHGHRLEPGSGTRRLLPPSAPQTGATAGGTAALRGSRPMAVTIRLGPTHRRRDPATRGGSPTPDSSATPALLSTPARLTPALLTPGVAPGAPCRRPWGRTPADTTTSPHHAAPPGRGRAPPPRTPGLENTGLGNTGLGITPSARAGAARGSQVRSCSMRARVAAMFLRVCWAPRRTSGLVSVDSWRMSQLSRTLVPPPSTGSSS